MWHSTRTGSGSPPPLGGAASRFGLRLSMASRVAVSVSLPACTRRRWPLSPDGQFLATGTRSGSVLILPVAGAGFRELRGFQGLVYSVAFDATGRRIAASGHVDGRRSEVIRVFDLETGDVKSFDPGDGKDLVTIAFLPDGNLLTSSFGGLRRIDADNRVLRAPGSAAGRGIPRSRRPARPAAPNGERQFSCGYGFRIRHAGAALVATRDPWQPGHADGLGSIGNAYRDRQPGWDRAGRSRNRRRTAPPDRP